MVRFLISTMVCLCCCGTGFAVADTGKGSLEVYGSWCRPLTSAVYMYVRNVSDKPVTLAGLEIDGAAESAKPWPLDPQRQADWFDFIPKQIGPGEVAQVRVHIRDQKSVSPVQLTVEASDGSRVEATIAHEAAPIAFSDITFARDGSEASLFVAGDENISQVFVDGKDESGRCDLHGAAAFQGTAAVFYHPETSLARGSYHTWEVRTTGQHRAIYTLRTLANDFVIGTYGGINFAPYKADHVNTYVSFHNLPDAKIAELSTLGMTGGPVPFVGGSIDAKTHQYVPLDEETTRKNIESVQGNSGALAFYGGPDEPDGADYPLGIGIHGRSMVAMRELAAATDPATPCFLQIDNTYRNYNYYVYAETMDYCASHRYNIGQDFQAGDRAAIKLLRDSAAPLPYFWVTQLYPVRENEAEHGKYLGRDPLPAEMHIQMLESLGAGTKGFIHYIHSGSKGGRGGSGLNKALWDSMGPMHEQIAAVGSVAVRSTPVAWATASDQRVHVSTLLSDPSNVLVVLTNDAIVSTKTDVEVPEINDVVVTVALPSWVKVEQASEISPGGESKTLQIQKQAAGISTTIQSMKEGTVLWLKGAQ